MQCGAVEPSRTDEFQFRSEAVFQLSEETGGIILTGTDHQGILRIDGDGAVRQSSDNKELLIQEGPVPLHFPLRDVRILDQIQCGGKGDFRRHIDAGLGPEVHIEAVTAVAHPGERPARPLYLHTADAGDDHFILHLGHTCFHRR